MKAALSRSHKSLHNYAGMHRALQMPTYSTSIDASSYIRTLCQSIKRAETGPTRDRAGAGRNLRSQLHSEQCWKLGMIISELITNSARHAFGDRGGTIRIELSSFGPFAQCSFMDNGSSKHSSTPGQGLKIIDALASELNGEIVHRFGIEGARSILPIPEYLQMENHESESTVNCGRATAARCRRMQLDGRALFAWRHVCDGSTGTHKRRPRSVLTRQPDMYEPAARHLIIRGNEYVGGQLA